jgi:nucleotide-binding universal stress UspA family protein
MSIETVLVAVNESDRDRVGKLGRTAADIAGPAGATVALAHVFTKDEYDSARGNLDFDRDSEVTPDVVAKRYATIRELGDVMDDRGVEFSWYGRLSSGTSEGEVVVDLAEELSADLVVVGGRRRSPTGKALFGSTAQEIILNAPCPVTFVREE